LLKFARKLNRTPGSIRKDDIGDLQAAGFSDRNIFDAVVLVAYFNFMNRIADGFGVEPEPEKEESFRRHLHAVIAAPRPDVAGRSD